MQIPGLAAYLAQQQGGGQQMPQGLAALMQGRQQQPAPQQKAPGGISQFLQGGGLGLIPALLSGMKL